jgi:hypothetical protein
MRSRRPIAPSPRRRTSGCGPPTRPVPCSPSRSRPARRGVLGNALVLIAPADSPVQLKIAPGFALAAALGGGRLASADPDAVPAGLYARAALTQLGVWDAVAPRLARGKRARRAGLRATGGDTARHRIPHRCRGRKARARRGRFSRAHASADRVPGGAHVTRAAASRAIRGLPQPAECPRDLRALRLHDAAERVLPRRAPCVAPGIGCLRIFRSGSPRTPAAARRECS